MIKLKQAEGVSTVSACFSCKPPASRWKGIWKCEVGAGQPGLQDVGGHKVMVRTGTGITRPAGNVWMSKKMQPGIYSLYCVCFLENVYQKIEIRSFILQSYR